jgi:organic radical activating enzyme
MFSCGWSGKHMDNETLGKIGEFIRKNNVNDVSIYGGEPFLDMEHFEKCFDELYDKHYNFLISSNGSFLVNPEKLRAVWRICRKMAYNQSDLGAKIRISMTDFHDRCRTEEMKNAIKKLEWVLKEPWSWHEEYDENENLQNPLVQDYAFNDGNIIYIDRHVGYDSMNPSGRALKTGNYNDKCCHCIMTASANTYESNDDMLQDVVDVAIDYKGNVGMCCSCNSGKIGNIRDFETLNDIGNAIMDFRNKFRRKYEIGSSSTMFDTCQKCLKFKKK